MKTVAIGGGHGTAVVLQALQLISSHCTGVVSTADDGGSSGQLRKLLNIPAVGDLRRCLSATANEELPLVSALERRIGPSQHPFGNLLLATAILEDRSVDSALQRLSEMMGSRVELLPASDTEVQLEGIAADGLVRGQVNVHGRHDIQRVGVVPSSAKAPASAIEAILEADLIVAGPGSLYTSVLAALVVPGVKEAIDSSDGRFVFMANLYPEIPETANIGLSEQVAALADHGIFPDVVVCNESHHRPSSMARNILYAPLTSENGRAHDPVRVARALGSLMAN